jgi:hypothetical protein
MNLEDLAALCKSHFWFNAGQSNDAGFQEVPNTSTYLPKFRNYVFDNPTQTWQQLQQNINNGGTPGIFRGYVGCEMRLMELMTEYYGAAQYMFKYSAGGTSISPIDSIETPPRYNWGPNSVQPLMYKGFIDSARVAMRTFPVQHIKPKVLLWIQGEDDTDPDKANAYQQNFINLIKAIKRDLNLPNLKVCQTLLADTQTAYGDSGKAIVNNGKINFSVNGNKYVNIDGADCPGGVHFSIAGQKYIAEKIWPVLKTML